MRFGQHAPALGEPNGPAERVAALDTDPSFLAFLLGCGAVRRSRLRAVVQRVSWAEVEVEGSVRGRIDQGLIVLLGISETDGEDDADFMARKLMGLRVFSDDAGKMNLAVTDLSPTGAVLMVPNFTVCGNTRKGRRPSYVDAAGPEKGEALFELVCERTAAAAVPTARGVFGAHMHCRLENDGPVTVIVESPNGRTGPGSASDE